MAFKIGLLRRMRALSNRVMGLDFDRTRSMPSIDTHLMTILDQYNIDTVIDVGANKGQFGLNLRLFGFGGYIYSFEPGNAAFEELKLNSEGDNKWFAYKIALGQEIGWKEFHVTSESVFSSFLRSEEWAENLSSGRKIASSENVRIMTFDEFYKANLGSGNTRRILLKMDTQGYDLQVFTGATGSLDHIFCILSEVPFCKTYQNAPSYKETLEAYQNAGFEITGLYAVGRNSDQTLIDMDCVLVKSERTKQLC